MMESNYIEEFHQYLNTIYDSIRFTRAEEHEGSLAFLFALVTRTPEGSLQTTVYRKAMHNGGYLSLPSTIRFNKNLAFPELFSSELRT